MSKPYLTHADVELYEEVREEGYDLTTTRYVSTTYWHAQVDGKLKPTKERVTMSRSAASAGEALLLLREAIETQGWELHE